MSAKNLSFFTLILLFVSSLVAEEPKTTFGSWATITAKQSDQGTVNDLDFGTHIYLYSNTEFNKKLSLFSEVEFEHSPKTVNGPAEDELFLERFFLKYTHNDKIQFKLENPCPDYFLSVYKKNQIERQQTRSKATQPLILSHDKTLYNFHDEAQFLALHRNMLSQAKRRIWLMANAINAPLLNDEQFRQSIIKLAKQNSQAEIRILLEDGKAGAGRFNPLVTLAQRLSSFVEIRSLPSTAHKFTEWVTLVDFSAGIYRKSLDSYSGFATYDSRLIAERLATKFEDQWQFAKPSVEFRRLAI